MKRLLFSALLGLLTIALQGQSMFRSLRPETLLPEGTVCYSFITKEGVPVQLGQHFIVTGRTTHVAQAVNLFPAPGFLGRRTLEYRGDGWKVEIRRGLFRPHVYVWAANRVDGPPALKL